MNLNNILIISGGQTGVDRAALDFALENKIKCGGFCPKDRKAEDGVISSKYPLVELETSEYEERTSRNVEYADGTIIFEYKKPFSKGTLLTIYYCQQYNKPYFIFRIDSEEENQIDYFHKWIDNYNIKILNVAGNRESDDPGIYYVVLKALKELLNP
jgi:predicted Rossmann-fold nucleotide-binding protein